MVSAFEPLIKLSYDGTTEDDKGNGICLRLVIVISATPGLLRLIAEQ